jgi:dimethylargininase
MAAFDRTLFDVPTIALTHVPSPRMNECIRTHAAPAEIDLPRALAQHDTYRRALAQAGAEVRVLETNAEHPDAVFIEDTAIVLDEIAILTSMGAESRREEPRAVEAALLPLRRVVRIEPPATIEGGDVVRVGKTLLVGRTARTNDAGIAALRALVAPYDYAVVAVDVRDCLHLKTACTALPDGALLVNRAWASDIGGFELVSVAPEEPHAANVVTVEGRAIMSSAYPRTAEIVGRHSREVLAVDLSEYAKGDGCATCLSLLVVSP